MSAASFLRSSFLQAINAVMLWLVRVEKVPQASEHLCPAKLQTSMLRLEVVTLWAPLSSCTVLPPCLTVNPQSDRSLMTEPSV